MVRKELEGEREIYRCEECGFGYADLKTAEECQQYCFSHESCSLEITRKAIAKPKL